MSKESEQQNLTAYFESNRDRFIEEWKEFLRFKSISTDPKHDQDCIACATWLSKHLEGLGFHSSLVPTPGKPMVHATYEPPKRSGPAVLFYGHYDVQPVDPIEAWTTPPFEPTIREGRLYARGAQDNKGQTFYVIKALEYLIKCGRLSTPVALLIEGEEEDGSKGITAALPSMGGQLKADILMVCDTGTIVPDCATITMGLRGLITLEIKLSGAAYDLHSGVFGGVAPNPALQMARLVTTLHNRDGSIAVQGYLDGVPPISEEDRKVAHDIPVPLDSLESVIGVPLSGGEENYTAIERRGFRPTIEINGLHSGYGGPGTKTIIPSYAIAKITSRLVAGQEPQRCLDLLIEHVKRHAPKGLKLDIVSKGIGGPAVVVNSASSVIQTAKGVLDRITPKGTCLMWEGASIPIIPALATTAGAEPLLVGFGLEEDCIHAPNESFSLEQFKRGFHYAAMLLTELGSAK
ncbi:MAG: M20/M25/M40 family metallo-hydrolase [Deltaproteobacteria bacterium]|nr:M20/M25/M40 family metallo-hydrolase [Deltaproteobacteria bacterium]